MRTYRLKLPDNGISCARDVEFEAPDALSALAIAREAARARSADLWLDGNPVGTIKEVAAGFWKIKPSPAAQEPGEASLLGTPRFRCHDLNDGGELPVLS